MEDNWFNNKTLHQEIRKEASKILAENLQISVKGEQIKKSEQVKELIKEVPEFEDKVNVVLENGFAVSRSEARRLVSQVGDKKENKDD